MEKAETLNEFFSSVFTKEQTGELPHFADRPFTTTLDSITISPAQIEKKLSKLNPTKSPGPDGIHTRILKEISAEISQPLAHLYSKSLRSGEVPQEWKDGHITPIFKQKGSRNEPSNYRPVQLTVVISKDINQRFFNQRFFLLLNKKHNKYVIKQHWFGHTAPP